MRHSSLIGIALAASALGTGLSSGATSFVYDFENQAEGDLFTGQVAGWTQDSPNPFIPIPPFPTFPLARIAPINFDGGATNGGELGTRVGNTADNSSTTLTGSLDPSALDPALPRFSIDLAIQNVDNRVARDAFSVALTDTVGEELVSLVFTPETTNPFLWNIAAGVNGSANPISGATLVAGSGFTFAVDLQPNGTLFTFGASQAGNSPVLLTSTQAVPGFGGRLANIEITHTPIAPAATSQNFLVFDNISVSVPEPSSSVLLALTGVLGLARRRRS